MDFERSIMGGAGISGRSKPLPRYGKAWEAASHALGMLSVELSHEENARSAATTLVLSEALRSSGMEGFAVDVQDLLCSLIDVLEGGHSQSLWRARSIYRASSHISRLYNPGKMPEIGELLEIHALFSTHPFDPEEDDRPLIERLDDDRVPDPDVVSTFEKWLEKIGEYVDDPPLIVTARAIRDMTLEGGFGKLSDSLARLMVPVLLHGQGALSRPLLFISPEASSVHEIWADAAALAEDWWLERFMVLIEKSASRSLGIVRSIRMRRDLWRKSVPRQRRTSRTYDAIDVILEHPVITADELRLRMDMGQPAAHDMIKRLLRGGVIQPISDRKSWRIFASLPLLAFQQR